MKLCGTRGPKNEEVATTFAATSVAETSEGQIN
jgi:hypothetical protein